MKKISEGKGYHVIAFCVSRFHNSEQMQMIQYACNYCYRYNCKVIFFSTLTDLSYDDENDRGEKQIYSVYDTAAFDAVVIMSETFKKTNVDREIADRAIRAGIPVISVNRRLEGCINIDFTYAESFEKIVRHVVEDHGCRHVNYIGGAPNNKFSEDRLNVYIKVLQENNIPFREERTGYGYFWDVPAVKVLDEFMKLDDELPEAIICGNDMMALAVCERLAQYGYRVPEDIIVTGFDGMEMEKYHYPRLTTAQMDWDLLMETIFETILSLLDGERVTHTILLPYQYRTGYSCGCTGPAVCDPTKLLFQIEAERGMEMGYQQNMLNMISRVGKDNKIQDICENLNEYMGFIGCRELWLCLNDFFWDKISSTIVDENESYEMAELKNYPLFSEKMMIAAHIKEGEAIPNQLIDRHLLLPDLHRVLAQNDYVMFLPMQMQNIVVGYMGISFEESQYRPSILYSFILNMRHLLEQYWYHVMQERLYCRDVLTSLYNRRGFYRQFKQMWDQKEFMGNTLTVISMDMDNLKTINDGYGHAEGDEALQRLAGVIRSVIVKNELAARIGGDEFLILTQNSNGDKRAEEIKNQIAVQLETFNASRKKPYLLRASYGYHTDRVTEYEQFEDLMRFADKEMYKDKYLNRIR